MKSKTIKLKNGDSYEGDYDEKKNIMQGKGVYTFS